MQPTAISAAIRPYSMAVAPLSSCDETPKRAASPSSPPSRADRTAARSAARLPVAWDSRASACGRTHLSAACSRALRASPATSGRRKVASEGESFRKSGTQMLAARGRPSWSKSRALPRVRGSAPPPGVSPGSSLPPGNSHSPASCLPSGRWAISTRRSASTSAQATTSRSCVHRRGRAVDVVVELRDSRARA